LYTLYADAQGDAKPEEFPDLLHPNDAGYAKWRAALWPLLATLGFVDREPDDFTPEEGFELLFNGRDLTGWGYRPNPAEDLALVESRRNDPDFPAWPIIAERVDFDGQPASPDGRYAAINGRLVVTTPSEGRKIQQLWTTADFPQEFTLRLQFRATPNTDSGVFVRGKQVQCRDYALAGPYKDLSSYKPQEWNDLEIAIADRRARCTVNGEVIEAAFEVPETGPIGLEGDRGQMEYRRIRVRRGGLPGP
ncbi:MAG TPA: family 16 glycoside hydrolase, partial [Lacipirellulaceae bacterium]|nr:family 16 glycoside hydrolase [Lacipirellulaceae bacterium]